MEYKKRKEEMVEILKREKYIKTENVRKAFLSVERENFVPENYKKFAYVDYPLPIGGGQTISAPSMIATMLEVAELKRGVRVLEIGSGSGYNAALIAEIVGDKNIITIERIGRIAEFAEKNLINSGHKVKVVCRDGSFGFEEEAPYDRIIATAAVPQIPPPWEEQVKENGIIVAPVGSKFFQYLVRAEKKNGKTKEKKICPCVFVPMVGEYGFRE